MAITPERHIIPPNKFALNSALPVLIYRDALPLPLSEEKTTTFLESHEWEKRGVWGHIPVRHFHPNSHECYGMSLDPVDVLRPGCSRCAAGIFRGESTLLLGRGQSDEHGGLEVDVHAGDVIVLPAGTAHCCLQSTQDYRYIGVYPKVHYIEVNRIDMADLFQGCPRWRNELGKEPLDVDSLRQEITSVAMPAQDPVVGEDGPLMQLWCAK
jgi:uncharacterized protein YjlB